MGMRTSFIASGELPAECRGNHPDEPEKEEAHGVHVQPRTEPLRRLAAAQRLWIQEGEAKHGRERGGEEAAPGDGRDAARADAEVRRRISAARVRLLRVVRR